jgi:hypothetical protein
MVTSFRDSVVVFQELNQRSSLESHKLDLMTEIGNLHLRQSRLERENLELREQLRAAEITSLKFSVRNRSYSFSIKEA